MTDLEKSMELLLSTFHRYAGEDSDGRTLSKKEFKKLVENELPSFLKAQQNPNVVDKIIKDLDENKDQKIDFEEFLRLINGISMACERCYTLQQQQQQQQKKSKK